GLPYLVRRVDANAEKLAVVRAATGAFPKAVSSGVERHAADLGFQKVVHREYDPETEDFSDILDQVERKRPDLLLAVGRIQNDLALAEQLAQRCGPLGAAAVVATPIQQFQEALGDRAEGFLGPSQWESTGSYPHSYGPLASQVLDSLRQEDQCSVDYPMVQSYAAGLVAQRCVEAAGTLDQDALREAASEQDFSTFYGRFKIDPESGRQIGRSVVVVQWQEGRKVIVWPPEQRQGELVYPWR
ncbi:MAG: ABC transporter substrate-binding protein, partial [Dehalococcoidia bacterium]